MALKETKVIGKTELQTYMRLQYERFDYVNSIEAGFNKYIDEQSAKENGPVIDNPKLRVDGEYEFTDEEWANVLSAVDGSFTLKNVMAAMTYTIAKKDERFKDMQDA